MTCNLPSPPARPVISTAAFLQARWRANLSAEASANISWKDSRGISRESTFFSVAPRLRATPEACDPFLSGDWIHPVTQATYRLDTDGLLTKTAIPCRPLYCFSNRCIDLHACCSDRLDVYRGCAVFILLRFPRLVSWARWYGGQRAGSRIGFSSLAFGPSTVFAGNAFGSQSTTTCSDGMSCAQVQVFAADNDGVFKPCQRPQPFHVFGPLRV